MTPLNSFLSALAFSMAGVAADVNAATAKKLTGSETCFQNTPVAQTGAGRKRAEIPPTARECP
ncbi:MULTISPECIES: hypothetical protein [unclassified Pseudomonas]|uniref:hypothetical protein n=1 Tax=unclassified Pseudomonas TaxID=196821 RepID=UPI0015A136D4|nr:MULTISPECIES: hypothetical protein [unclassified Pseudomonas]NWC96752.1 hypothetical protein [Pseudomonas sp. IPO3779]NWD21557.1 hypothetical protein [Pseudomonas sp. IPO3778]